MSRTPRASAHRGLLATVSVALAATLAACGGGSGGHQSGASGHSSASAASASAGASARATSGAGQGMGMSATPTYPSVVPGPAAAGPHNDIDILFATDMIPHHGQAVVMADMILARTSDPQVKALAETITKAQTPEISAMSGWLKGWGQPVPDPYAHSAGMAGMEHGGMMSAEQMKQLSDATGPQADKAFLSLMIDHHQGAIDMAKGELERGSNPQVKALAQTILTTQAAEITRMRELLG